MRYFKKEIIYCFMLYYKYYTHLIKIDYSNIDILLKFRPFIEYHGVDGILVRREINWNPLTTL